MIYCGINNCNNSALYIYIYIYIYILTWILLQNCLLLGCVRITFSLNMRWQHHMFRTHFAAKTFNSFMAHLKIEIDILGKVIY